MFRILSIDGGGIRGIIPGEVLVRFEGYLQKYSGRPDARIGDYFDLICGTSTGAILAALYVFHENEKLKYTARDVVNLYYEHGSRIFQTTFLQRLKTVNGLLGTKYVSTEVERLLQLYFGDATLSDLRKPCLIPCYDMEGKKAVFFNQTDPIRSGKEDFRIRDVLRGATAVPSFFSPKEITCKDGRVLSLIDGAVVANNPALCGLVEGGKVSGGLKVEEIHLLSIGTGAHEGSYSAGKVQEWGQLQWIRPMVEIMAEGASEIVDFQIDKIFKGVNRKENYLRIQPDLSAYSKVKLRFDDASRRNIELLRGIGEQIGNEKETQLKAFAKKMVELTPIHHEKRRVKIF